MNNNEYKEIKLPEEMSKEEKIDLMLENPIPKNEGENVHGLLYNIVGFIGFLFFTVFFGGAGLLAFLQEDSDSGTKAVASIFLIYTVVLIYKTIKYAISIKSVLKGMKEEKRVVISLQNIGYFIYSLAFLIIMSMFILMFINPESKLLNDNFMLLPYIAIGFGIVGTIIIYIDRGMRLFHKETKVVEINSDKKDIDK